MFFEQNGGRTQNSAELPHFPTNGAAKRTGAAGSSTASPTFMIGNCTAMCQVFEQIRRFATFDVPVLITGESGTGKELAARAIHERSHRSQEPFIAINCAAGPATLIGSELFGYEKGNSTGSLVRKQGQIEHANGGTLFLDEIDEMPLDLQRHLLLLLEEAEIVRVGGLEPLKVDVRIIAATHAHPREAVRTGKLRDDLYYRLNVLGLFLPPLRERIDDIEVLATFFLRQMMHDLDRDIGGFTPETIDVMRAYPWPGNVRELIATIRRALVLTNGPLIQPCDLCLERFYDPVPEAGRLSRPSPGTSAERELLLKTLQRFDFNITRTAHELAVSRVTLYRMLQRNCLALRHGCVAQGAGPADLAGAGA